MLITSVCFAQDIIVKKDGGTIQAKVIEVGKYELKYKKFDNQDGPTYTISTQELQSINYENGTKDSFVSPNYNPNIVTNETATQYSNDNELLALYKSRTKKIVTPQMLYKKGKRLKIAGYTVGGTLVAAGIVSMIVGVSQKKYNDEYECLHVYNGNESHFSHYDNNNNIRHYQRKYYNDTKTTCMSVGLGTVAGGVIIGVPLILKGTSLQKKNCEQVYSVSAISQEINFDNGSSLNFGIDMISGNHSYTQTPGIGLRYNF